MPIKTPNLLAKRFMQCVPGELIQARIGGETRFLLTGFMDNASQKAAIILGKPSLYMAPVRLETDVLAFGDELQLVVPPEQSALIGPDKINAPPGCMVLVGNSWFLYAHEFNSDIADEGYLDLQSYGFVRGIPRNDVGIYFRRWSLRVNGSDDDVFTFAA